METYDQRLKLRQVIRRWRRLKRKRRESGDAFSSVEESGTPVVLGDHLFRST